MHNYRHFIDSIILAYYFFGVKQVGTETDPHPGGRRVQHECNDLLFFLVAQNVAHTDGGY